MNGMQVNAAYSPSSESGPVTNIVEFSITPARIFISDNVHAWNEAVVARLTELVRLPFGWDGYRGVPMGLANAYFTLRMLEKICRLETDAPQIVPGDSGDLQIEWHTLKGDIELHVRSPNSVHAWRSLPGGRTDGDELELTNDFSAVAQWVKDIVESAH